MKIKRVTEDEPLFIPGVTDQDAGRRALAQLLHNEDGTPKPYCTCHTAGGFGFDQQMGIFVHRSEKVLCNKPSKRYYEVALEAGILVP